MTKRRLLSILAVASVLLPLILSLIPFGTVLAAPSLKESHYGTSQTAFSTYDPNYFCFQTFTATSSYVVSSVRPNCYRTGSPGNLTVDLYHLTNVFSGYTSPFYTGATFGSYSSPVTTPLSSGTADTSGLATTEVGASYLQVDMTPYYIKQGDVYAFVVKVPSGNSTNKVTIMANGDGYSGGYGYYTTTGGGGWSYTDNTRDLRFEVWGEALATYPTVSTITVTSINSTTVTFSGNLTGLGAGASSCNVSFEWDFYDYQANCYLTATSVTTETGTTEFSQNVTLPVGGRPYLVRALALNDLGYTAYGETLYFDTDEFPITLVTQTMAHIQGAITHAFQRKAVYAVGRHWLFAYLDSSVTPSPRGFYYSSSDDGLTWNNWTLWWTPDARETGNEADEFSIYYDGTYIHVVYVLNRWYTSPNSNDMWYRRGLPDVTGNITWSADWQIAKAQDEGVSGYPTVATDAYGHVYISFWDSTSHTGPLENNHFAWVTRSDNTDGTWSTTSGYPIALAPGDDQMFTCVLPLGGTNMYVITTNTGSGAGATRMLGHLYNGSSWDTSGVIINDISSNGGYQFTLSGRNWATVSQAGKIYLVYGTIETYNGVVRYLEYSGGTWGTTVNLTTDLNEFSEVGLCLNGATEDVYVFWTDYGNLQAYPAINETSPYCYHIRYLKCTDGVWDETPTDWINESRYKLATGYSTGGKSSHLMTYPQVYAGKIAVYYQTGSGDGSYTEPTATLGIKTDVRMDFLEVQSGPAVETLDACDVTTVSATLQGYLVNTGGQSTQARFQYGTSESYGNYTAWQSVTTGQTFNAEVSGLEGDTTIYFRAMAKWADDTTTYGEQNFFTTGDVPYVQTNSAVDVTNTGATLQGTIQSLAEYPTVYASFQYGTTTSYGTNTAEQTKTVVTSFSQAITGLTAGVTYHFRARLRYGTNNYVYGSDNSFTTTTSALPTVTTGSAASVTQTGAVIQGSVTSMGDQSTVYVYFQWGLTTGYEQSPTAEQTETAIGGFSASLSGLTASTTYYFRAVLRYGSNYVYGAQGTFTTTGAAGEPGIDPPDILRIDDVKVFSGYYEDGDQLYVINYRAVYLAGDPAIDIGDYFDFVLMDGVVTRAKIPVKSWGYRPGSIYLKATSALSWGGEYTVSIIGNPNKWDTPPSDDWILSAGDWQGTDLTQLDTWVIALATSLETYYDIQMVAYDQEPYLTDQAMAVFATGIPGLCQVRPNICSVSMVYTPTETGERDVPTINPDVMVGPEITETVNDVAAFFALDDMKAPGAIGFGIAFFAVGILLTVLLGGWGAMSGAAGMAFASPVVILGAQLGYVPWAIIIIIAAIAVLYSLIIAFVKGS